MNDTKLESLALALVLTATASVLPACDSPADSDEIVANLVAAGHAESEVVVEDGLVFIDGDLVSLEDSWEPIDEIDGPEAAPVANTSLQIGAWTFEWSYHGSIPNMYCTQIHEGADPHAWHDNYFCSSVNIGMAWSSAGAIPGMVCTQIHEGADPYTWNDNYLCLPPNAGVAFHWSPAGSPGSNSIQWLEPADPHTWNDNYLQIAPAPGDACAGQVFANNVAAQAGCPGVCSKFGLSSNGNWTNLPSTIAAAGCEVGAESVCWCS